MFSIYITLVATFIVTVTQYRLCFIIINAHHKVIWCHAYVLAYKFFHVYVGVICVGMTEKKTEGSSTSSSERARVKANHLVAGDTAIIFRLLQELASSLHPVCAG